MADCKKKKGGGKDIVYTVISDPAVLPLYSRTSGGDGAEPGPGSRHCIASFFLCRHILTEESEFARVKEVKEYCHARA